MLLLELTSERFAGSTDRLCPRVTRTVSQLVFEFLGVDWLEMGKFFYKLNKC